MFLCELLFLFVFYANIDMGEEIGYFTSPPPFYILNVFKSFHISKIIDIHETPVRQE
jgi:hypothetical protein